jgi:hypothetical protein
MSTLAREARHLRARPGICAQATCRALHPVAASVARGLPARPVHVARLRARLRAALGQEMDGGVSRSCVSASLLAPQATRKRSMRASPRAAAAWTAQFPPAMSGTSSIAPAAARTRAAPQWPPAAAANSRERCVPPSPSCSSGPPTRRKSPARRGPNRPRGSRKYPGAARAATLAPRLAAPQERRGPGAPRPCRPFRNGRAASSASAPRSARARERESDRVRRAAVTAPVVVSGSRAVVLFTAPRGASLAPRTSRRSARPRSAPCTPRRTSLAAPPSLRGPWPRWRRAWIPATARRRGWRV